MKRLVKTDEYTILDRADIATKTIWIDVVRNVVTVAWMEVEDMIVFQQERETLNGIDFDTIEMVETKITKEKDSDDTSKTIQDLAHMINDTSLNKAEIESPVENRTDLEVQEDPSLRK
jgi:hypothetical protein